MTEPLQGLRIAWQLPVQHLLKQIGPAVVLDVLTHGLSRNILHGAGLLLRLTPKGLRFGIREPQGHRHAAMVFPVTPRAYGSERAPGNLSAPEEEPFGSCGAATPGSSKLASEELTPVD